MSHVEELIGQIQINPSIVTELYPALTKEEYWVLVAPDYTDLETAGFVTYDCPDGIKETPIFTSPDFKVLKDLKSSTNAQLVKFDGKPLMKRLLDIVDDEVQIAINPGWHHGIRISRSLLLSITSL